MFKKTKKEVIEMEQTTFVQKHAKKILLAGGVVVAAGTVIILKKHDIDIAKIKLELDKFKNKLNINTEIAIKALEDTIADYEFEIEELTFKRDNLNESQQNIFMNIPKINEEIELKTKLMNNAKELLAKAIETGKEE